MNKNRTNTLLLLFGIVFISFIVKLVYWIQNPTVSRDGCVYIRLSQIWYHTGVYPDIMLRPEIWNRLPPLQVYIVKNLMYTGLSAEIAGVALSLFLSTFIPLFAYGIAYAFLQRKDIAVCSAFLIAFNPTTTKLAVQVQRDMLYLFFAGMALWLLSLGIQRKKCAPWFGMGFAVGCAVLTRYESLEFLIAACILFLFICVTPKKSFKKTVLFAAIFFLSFLITLSSLSILIEDNNRFIDNYENFINDRMTRIHKHYFYKMNHED